MTTRDDGSEEFVPHQFDEKFGRIVAFQFEVSSTSRARTPYISRDYKIPEKDIIPWEKCSSDKHTKFIPEEQREDIENELENAKCLDFSDTSISGGTNSKRELTERKVILKLQYCKHYAADPSTCPTDEETGAYMSKVEV